MYSESTGLTKDHLDRALASRQLSIRYDFRLVDESNAVWSLSGGAVINRSRSFALDNGSWQLSLTILKDRVPKGLTIQQYHRIEVDRGISGGLWAYFRGQIMDISESTTRRGGSYVETIEIKCEGTLSRLRGVYVPRVQYSAKPRIWPAPLLGIARTITYKETTSISANDHVALKGNSHVYLRETAPSSPTGDNRDVYIGSTVVISKNSAFTSLYVQDVDYHVKTNVVPYQIEWRITPVDDVWIRYRVVDRWVSPKWIGPNLFPDPYNPITRSVTAAAAFGAVEGTGAASSGIYVLSQGYETAVPSGTRTWTITGTVDWVGLYPQTPVREKYFLCDRRDPQNLLQTTISAVSTSGTLTITPRDFGAYASGISSIASGGVGTEPGTPLSAAWLNTEYITVTFPDGEEGTSAVTGINRTTGVLTFSALPVHPVTGANPAVGYPMRVSTCEGYAAWDDSVQCDLVLNESGLTGLTSTNILSQTCYKVTAWAGIAQPTTGHRTSAGERYYWLSTDYVYAAMGTPDTFGLYSGGTLVIDRRVKTQVDHAGNRQTVNEFETAIQLLCRDSYVGFDAIKPFTFDRSNTYPAGIGVRNFTLGGDTLDNVIKNLISNNAPPNLLITDAPNGGLGVIKYTQKALHDYVLPGIASVRSSNDSDRITSVVVISKPEGDSINLASRYFGGISKPSSSSSTFDIANGQFIVDGVGDDDGRFAEVGSGINGAVWFNIPPLTPYEAYPIIEKVVIKGAGGIRFLMKPGRTTEFITSTTISGGAATSLNDTVAIGTQSRYILSKEGVTFDEQDIKKAIRPECWNTLLIYFDGTLGTVDGSSKAGLYEVEIYVRQVNAHAAKLSDNVNLANNTSLNSAGFGTIWSQVDPSVNASFRYAPEAFMKRNAAAYGGKITDYYVTNRGSGYTGGATISISGTGTGAAATAYVETGLVKRVEVTALNANVNRGSGYTAYPSVSVSGTGTGATVHADIVQHRTRILEMKDIDAQTCRTYAENYMDEYLRSHLVYTVEAPLLDYAEPGDTVLVQLPDGTQKTLLLWGISDSGGPGDNMATYELRDYSL